MASWLKNGRNRQSKTWKPGTQNSTAPQTGFRCGGKGHSPVWRKGMTCNYCKSAVRKKRISDGGCPAGPKQEAKSRLWRNSCGETQATREESKPEIRAVVQCMVGKAKTRQPSSWTRRTRNSYGRRGLISITDDGQLENVSRRPLNADRSPMEGDLKVVVSIGPSKVFIHQRKNTNLV
eukprot:GHVO01052541.1.p1 GENE.GHVO01052541.1~~GHVO01052541.1.p1  ORF type:complete len:178 (-),score=6.47 GHVO01052541.1:1045-1578(-)